MKNLFEQMVDDVVEGQLDESAVVDYYFLVNYPYGQGDHNQQADGDIARAGLDRLHRQPMLSSLGEASPPGWSGTVKAMKRHMSTNQAFARAWAMHNRGARPHYRATKK